MKFKGEHMINIKDLEDAIYVMQGPKLPRGIKVTKQFWNYIESVTAEISFRFPYTYFGEYQGLPVEVDDEIDGPYEFIY
jgi:hypothetical protein